MTHAGCGPPANPEPSATAALQGSRLFAARVADRDDLLVELLEQRGAIIVGKTNTPELGAGSQTYNE